MARGAIAVSQLTHALLPTGIISSLASSTNTNSKRCFLIHSFKESYACYEIVDFTVAGIILARLVVEAVRLSSKCPSYANPP